MRKTTLIILLFGAIIFSVKAIGQDEKSLVIIRVIEFRAGYTGGLSPVIHITENDGSYRVIELDKHSKNYLIKPTDNQRKIHQELKKYILDGYEIVGHTKGIESVAVWFEDYVLIKN